MSPKPDDVTVQVKYQNIDKTFQGSAEETWLLLCKFFGEFVPTFEVARKLWVNVDVQKLAKDCEGLIAFSPEGPNILAPKNKLTDNETLSLWLLANYLGCRLSITCNDALSKDELQMRLGKSSKITSTRLGELVKNDSVVKTVDDKFRMTAFGVVQMQKDILPKIKSKILS